MKKVAIIDYGSGNLRSAEKAFERAAAGIASILVTDNPKELETATHIVLPGVGAFADCMRGLMAISGMRAVLENEVREKRKPFLGVCVGMQMLFERGYEHGKHEGLGWIAGEVVKIGSGLEAQGTRNLPSSHKPEASSLKIPHMGWNDLRLLAPEHALLAGINTGDHAYFVHSYHAQCDGEYVLATADYGGPITAVVGAENIMGTQFHPEKSQETGLKLIANFLTF